MQTSHQVLRKSTVLRTPRSTFWHCPTSWKKWAWNSSCQPYCAWTTQQLKCSRTTLQTRLVSSTSTAGKNGSKCCETSRSSSHCMYPQRTTWRTSSPRSCQSQHLPVCVIDCFTRRNRLLLLKCKSIKLEEAIENILNVRSSTLTYSRRRSRLDRTAQTSMFALPSMSVYLGIAALYERRSTDIPLHSKE